jgi:hypothetical protein
MIERRNSARLALEPFAELLGGKLNRHLPAQAGVERTIDFAHPTGAKQPENFVGTNAGPRFQGHGAVTLPRLTCLTDA